MHNNTNNEAKSQVYFIMKTYSSREGKSRRRRRRWRRRASARGDGMRSRVRRCLRHFSTAAALSVAALMHMRTNKLSIDSSFSNFSCAFLFLRIIIRTYVKFLLRKFDWQLMNVNCDGLTRKIWLSKLQKRSQKKLRKRKRDGHCLEIKRGTSK